MADVETTCADLARESAAGPNDATSTSRARLTALVNTLSDSAERQSMLIASMLTGVLGVDFGVRAVAEDSVEAKAVAQQACRCADKPRATADGAVPNQCVR